MTSPDWDPRRYGRFRGLRLRPALDLLAEVPDLAEGPVVDLGCGAGAVAGPLAARFPSRKVIGVDNSPAMLAKAAETGLYTALEQADAAAWHPAVAPALIFSNALLQWLPDHARLLPRLAGLLTPGGILAVQMPRQQDAPSHRLMAEVAQALFPGRGLGSERGLRPVGSALDYAQALAPLGEVEAWETEYVQRLPPAAEGAGHPVRGFTESTGLRPYLAPLDPEEARRFLAAYDAALATEYSPQPDGSVLFPFRRVFFILARP